MRERASSLLAATRMRAQHIVAWFAASAYARRPLPWKQLLRMALPLWIITRLLALVITYLSQTMLRASVAQSPRPGAITLDSLVTSWRLWDGGFYGGIVQSGYTQAIDAVFWPLYPLLAKPFELLLGADRWPIALLIVSNLATLAAFVLVGALALHEDETLGAANRTMRILAATPLALFLTAAYSDSLFLALAAATLLCARRGAWRAAVLWAFLAALSRPMGAILIAPLLWEYGQRIGWGYLRKRLLREWLLQAMVLAGAVPLAVGLYSVYCWYIYDDPLAWVHAEVLFNHVAMAPWSAIGYA